MPHTPVHGNIDGARVMAAALQSEMATHMFVIRLDTYRVALVFGDCETGEIYFAAWITNQFVSAMASLLPGLLVDFLPELPEELQHGNEEHEPMQEHLNVSYGGGFNII